MILTPRRPGFHFHAIFVYFRVRLSIYFVRRALYYWAQNRFSAAEIPIILLEIKSLTIIKARMLNT